MAKQADPTITKLKEHVRQSEQSQNQLAVNAGMTPQRLSNLLNGRGLIQPAEIRALCAALGIPVSALFEE